VIVDDCSTDRTVERIEAWLRDSPIQARLVVNERNLGLCACRNIALCHAQGEFISSVSGDDYYEPEKLERQYRFWETLDGSAAAVFSNEREVDEQGCEIGVVFPSGFPPAEGRIFDRLIEGNFMTAPTVMARRSALEEIGGYDESLFYGDEVILCRAWRNGLRVLAADRRRGRRVLQDVCAARPSLRRRVGVAASAVPGVGHALAATFAVADRLRK
jgi:glycosyltransferase involved in cell wall biosynthesis